MVRCLAVLTVLAGGLFLVSSPGAGAQDDADPLGVVTSDGSALAVAEGAADMSPFRGRPGEVSPEAGPANVPALSADAATEVIIGKDTRGKNGSYFRYPFRASVLVLFKTATGSNARCSGAMIGPSTVATAGHCVHGGAGSAFHTNVRVFPGASGNVAVFGSCRATRLFTVNGWANSSNTNFDMGAINLDCNVGRRTGWLGMTAAGTRLIPNGGTFINGYPGDKPLQQWFSWNGALGNTPTKIFYINDTTGGMSGSPVTQYRGTRCEVNCIVGIHTNGRGLAPFPAGNSGRLIDGAALRFFKNVRAAA